MLQNVFKKIAGCLFLVSTAAVCGVEIGGTRLIYDSSSSQAAISVNNPDNTPYLIQSWVSSSENSDDGDSPFITTPPLFKLNPHAQNSVRVVLMGNSLPQDRESVYWLNIKSIPSSSADAKNELLIAVKSKMKVFYRPAGLDGDPSVAYQKLTFSATNGKLNVHNPSPYSVSLYHVKVNGKELATPPMVLPFQTLSLSQSALNRGKISWRAINDFGGITAEHTFNF